MTLVGCVVKGVFSQLLRQNIFSLTNVQFKNIMFDQVNKQTSHNESLLFSFSVFKYRREWRYSTHTLLHLKGTSACISHMALLKKICFPFYKLTVQCTMEVGSNIFTITKGRGIS